MDLNEYQRLANTTDQATKNETENDPKQPERHLVVPLLGLAGEVGTLLTEYKKKLRDGNTHLLYKDHVKEELGDILWYVSNIAGKFNLDLNDVAQSNLEKIEGRWQKPESAPGLYDSQLPNCQQLPRKFKYQFVEQRDNDRTVLIIRDVLRDNESVGDKLTDNA